MKEQPHVESPGRKEWRSLLGIVVVGLLLLGVFAALAVVAMRKYLTFQPTAEASNTIGRITVQVVAHYEQTHTLCASASSPVPASIDAIRGRKYIAKTAEWAVDAPRNAGFACLGFAQLFPQNYQYDYRSDGTSFIVTAKGDLDADGKLAEFSQTGRIENGKLVLEDLKSPDLEH